jgi:hypothetical protein
MYNGVSYQNRIRMGFSDKPIKETGMNKLEDLLAQQEHLSQQIEDAKKLQKVEDLKTVRKLCKAHGFTGNMLKGYLSVGRTRKSKSS